MTAEECIVWTEEQLKRALEQVQLAAAKFRTEELGKQKTPPPAFVKANVVKAADKQKKSRKRRAAQDNRARRRQVIELPPPPLEVTDHVVYRGWCSQCQKWHKVPLRLSAEARGQGRMGAYISSLIAYLRTVLHMPVRQIQVYLTILHRLEISTGEIVGVSQRLSWQMQTQVEVLQADETGWREEGKNSYNWSASRSQVRYYEYHRSRGIKVVKHWLRESFEGMLYSNFFASYNIYQRLQQRCWAHLLRDGHDLKKQYPDDVAMQHWLSQCKGRRSRACSYAGLDPNLPPAKQQGAGRQRYAFEQELMQLCSPDVGTSAPRYSLCERVQRVLPELFAFMALPEVGTYSILAEPNRRPLVIERKISGSSRMDLFSLFGTWAAQRLNPFFQCLAELS